MPDSLVRVLEPEHVGLARSWAPKVDELGRAHRRAAHQRSCGGLLLHRSADPSRPTRQRSADEPSRPTVCRPPLSPSTRNVRIDPTSEAAQGQPRPGGYRYYQNGCYQQRPDGAWVVVAPEYCAVPPPAPVAVEPPPPPPPRVVARDELQERMLELRAGCEDGDRRACVRLGILIGENRARRAAWRREHPEVFFYER